MKELEVIKTLKKLYEKDQQIDKELKEISKSRDYFENKQVELQKKLTNESNENKISDFKGKRERLKTMG